MKPQDTGFSFKPMNSGLYQDQQGYYKEFKFKEGTEKLNLILLDNIDVDRLYYTGNIIEAQSALKNFASSKLTTLDIETMNYDQYYKLFRLSQLAMEHYTQQQLVKQQQSEMLFQQFQSNKEKCQKLEKIRMQLENKKDEMQNSLQILNEKIDDIKQETLKIGQFKCIYCNKTFREKAMLKSHVKRRHQEQLDEIKAQNELIKDENPVMKIKQLEEERIQMQEMVHLKQMQQLQRIHEKKLNEEKLIEQLAQKMQTDIHQKIDTAFKENRDLEHEEEQIRRNEEQKQQIMNNVTEMKEMFNLLKDQFSKFEKHQSEMSQKQHSQQKYLQKIETDQKLFAQKNEEDLKKLEQQKKESQQVYQEMKERDTQLMVSNYVDALAESVCSVDFQENLKQSKLQQEQKLREENKKKQIPLLAEKVHKDDKANIFHIGDLEDDENSSPEDVLDQEQLKKQEIERILQKKKEKEKELLEYQKEYNKNQEEREKKSSLSQKQSFQDEIELSDSDLDKKTIKKNVKPPKPQIQKQFMDEQQDQKQQEEQAPVINVKSRIGGRRQISKRPSQNNSEKNSEVGSVHKGSQQDLEKKSQNSSFQRRTIAHEDFSKIGMGAIDLLSNEEAFKNESQRWEKEKQQNQIMTESMLIEENLRKLEKK